jgi:tetratricopeptide (TPR) repeat protein
MYLLPDSLVERLKNRQAILVTGLGCAELAGLPGWLGLCQRMAEWIEDEAAKQAFLDLLGRGHLATAAALLRDLVAVDALAEVLVDAYPPAREVPESIRAVARAPFRGIVATGFDALWANALAAEGCKPERIVGAAGAAALEPGRGRFLVQPFGQTGAPDSLCLIPAELGPKVVATGASDFLLALHRKWSFVYVGYGPDAPDLAMLAGRLLGASKSAIEHYLVCPGLSDLDARRVRAEHGLHPVATAGSLEDALAALVEACRLAGDKPTVDNVEAWLERLTAEPADEEARAMVEQGLAVLREHREWERAVAALVNRAELGTTPQDQAADLAQAGRLLEQELGAADRAYAVLMMALHLAPHDAVLLADARRVAHAAGQDQEFHDELAAIEKEAAGAPEADQMALGVARLLAEDPSRREEAIGAFGKLLDRDPDNAEAFAGLEALLRKAERWDALGTLLNKAVARDPGSVALTAKLEEVFERTRQNTPLVELLSERIARDPQDQAALAKLEARFQSTQKWQELVLLYQRLLKRNPDNAETRGKLEAVLKQTQRWQELGALYEQQLAERAGDAELLGKIEDLYRQSEQWRALAEHLERRARQQSSKHEARALRLERAGVLLDKCRDTEAALAVARAFLPDDATAAEEILAKCLERDPASPAPLLAMADLAKGRGDYLRAAKFLLDAAGRTQNPLELGRIFAEAGTIQIDHLGDEERAIECFAGALNADPEETAAATRLLALREKREDWAAAELLYDLVLRKTEAGATRCDLLVRQAECARRLGKLDKAVAALVAATEIDRGSATLAQELADLHVVREAWAEAREEYTRAKGLLGVEAGKAVLVSLYEKLARCERKLDDPDAAVRRYEEALALEPHKRGLIEAILELRRAREEWREVIAAQRKLVPLAASDEERTQVLEEIADIMQERLHDWPAAMEAYLQVLALEPERRPVLYKTLDYYTAEKQWPTAIATLEKLVGLESEPAARARLNYALAAIYRDEMKDTSKAVERFGKVLDDDPLHGKAFDAIEKLLGEAKDWKDLERAYRKQIKRLPPDAPTELKLRLWDGLADVSLKLHDKESALLTLEVAASFDRENLARQERLAKMYFDLGPSKADKAIAQHQQLLRRKPDRLESYKALAALFFQAGAHDKMWCVAGAMTYLGKADPPLRALFENYRPTQSPTAAGKLTGELWRKVVHPDESPYLDALFGLLGPALAMTTAQPPKALGLDKHARADVASDAWPYAAALRYVANTIEAAVPEVYVKKDAPGTVIPVNLKDKHTLVPSLIVGMGFGQLSSQSELIFDLAKRMMQLRPERLPRLALASGAALDIAVRAGLTLGGAAIGPGEHGPEVDKMVRHLEGLLAGPVRAELKGVARRYVEACGERVDTNTWIVASDLTASRVALALCGDIVAASRVLALEPTGQSPLAVAERMNDLLSYFVSDDYFAVRAGLGMQVNLTPPTEPAGQRPRRMSHMQIKTQE